MYSWDAAELLGVIANERRLKVLSALAGAEPAGLGLDRIAERTGLSPRSAARILDRLAAAGLVRKGARRSGAVYRAEPGRIADLVGFLGRRLGSRSAPVASAARPATRYRSLRAKLGKAAPALGVAEIAAAVEARAA